MQHLYSDVEFDSAPGLDLTKVGLHKVLHAPETVINRLAFAIDDGEVQVWRVQSQPAPASLIEALEDLIDPTKESRIVGYNAECEWLALNYKILPELGLGAIDASRVHCLMVQAMLSGIRVAERNPSLAGACELVGISQDESKDLKALARCNYEWAAKRLKKEKIEPVATTGEETEEARDQYVMSDVLPLRELMARLVPLVANDREGHAACLSMNAEGAPIDRALALAVCELSDGVVEAAHERMQSLVGLRATQREKVRAALAELGLSLPNMQGETLATADFSKATDPVAAEQIVGAYVDANAKAGDKFAQALAMSIGDRVHGVFNHAAAHTRRDTSRILNLQNMRRPDFGRGLQSELSTFVAKQTPNALGVLSLIDTSATRLIKNLERNLIKAPPGKWLAVGDFSKAEPMSLYMITGEKDGDRPYHDLAAMALNLSNETLWGLAGHALRARMQAQPNYEVTAGDIDKSTDIYALAKRATLGAGYGLSLTGFLKSLAGDGLTVSRSAAEVLFEAVGRNMAERNKFAANCLTALRFAVQQGKTTKLAGGLIKIRPYKLAGGGAEIVLPSGSAIRYRRMTVSASARFESIRYELRYQPGFEKSSTGKPLFQSIHGGTILENVASSLARDFLYDALIRAQEAGLKIVAQVHDELVCEIDDPSQAKLLEQVMNTAPKWAFGFAMKAEVEVFRSYTK